MSLKKLMSEYQEKGWTITNSKNGHFKWVPPSGSGCTFTSGSPSDRRALLNIKADLRRLEMQEEALKKEEDQKLVFQAVESSNVDRVAYDGKDLYVAFINKSLYRYLDVPVTYYEGLIGAESVGRFLNQSIKGVFQFEKVDYNMLKGDQNVTTTVLSNSQAN